ASFKWKTFSDEEYADWKEMSKKNTQVPLRSFFDILKMKQYPMAVADRPPKPSLLSLAEERLAKNLCASTCVWIGKDTYFDCIPSLLKCYSVWFATRDWRLQEFKFEANDVPAIGFEMLYKWMRTTEVPELDNVVPTLQAANHLKVSLLYDGLWARVCDESVQEKIAFRCYLQAQNLPQLGQLREIMLIRVRNYFLPLVGSQEFMDLDVNVLEKILLLDTLGVNTEIEVFFAVLRWVGNCPKLVNERLPHLQRLMECVRFQYMPTAFLFDLRNSCNRADNSELFRSDPVIVALNQDPQTMEHMTDAITFIGTRCQCDTKEFMEMCRRKVFPLVYPRKWQYHSKCSYHVRHNKSSFPHTNSFTAADFNAYVESLQEEWSGDGPADLGKSQMEDLDEDILFSLRDGSSSA
ncbi:hypothetical protein KR074_000516, partial [Drosophila pseudoananassae]